MRRLTVFLMLMCFSCTILAKKCPGKFVNPVTDVCWSCMFPISIGSGKFGLKKREDTRNPKSPVCQCPKLAGLPLPGLSIGFWEPIRLIDVTRKPYCMVGMGGIQMGANSSVGHGGHSESTRNDGTKTSFYQVHWYFYPLISWLQLITDFACLERVDFDVAYLTELDPLWNDDELSFIINPEAILFSNKIAQLACAADCVSASVRFPLDPLFWCGGCQGSIYPFTGSVVGHSGGVQASLLIAQRFIAKLHREMLLPMTASKKKPLCRKPIAPFIKKSQYKIQMVYPRPTSKDGPGYKACIPIGRTDVFFGSTREFPYKGEDFSYLIWRKRNCCAL